MARAKRTERAAARRRYRAAVEADELATGDDQVDSAPSTAGSRAARPNAAGVRLGIVAALRASIHPVRVRDDLAALPSLVTHRALWLPVLLTVATAVAVASLGRASLVANFATTYFLEAPAIGGVFLAGFLAPRASWLLGLIVGLVAAACYTVVMVALPLQLFPPEMFKTAPGPADWPRLAVSAFILSPIMGALFAAAAAWYRRFLTLTNPNRGRRSQPAKRVGDGRTRGASNEKAKAGARR